MTSQDEANLLLAEHQGQRKRSLPDQEIAPAMERIEQYSGWLVSDAETVQRTVRSLKYQHGFDTQAEATLHLAKDRLESAMREVNNALTDFAAKPKAA
jgi:hypothetical protein